LSPRLKSNGERKKERPEVFSTDDKRHDVLGGCEGGEATSGVSVRKERRWAWNSRAHSKEGVGKTVSDEEGRELKKGRQEDELGGGRNEGSSERFRGFEENYERVGAEVRRRVGGNPVRSGEIRPDEREPSGF